MSDSEAVIRAGGGDEYEATTAAAGPWGGSQLHGGAPAALLASILECLPASVPMEIARLTVDLLRPVPINTTLRIEVREGRQGLTAHLAAADLFFGDSLLAKATGFRVRGRPSRSRP